MQDSDNQDPGYQPRPSRSGGGTALAVLAAVVLLGVICCGGVFALALFGIRVVPQAAPAQPPPVVVPQPPPQPRPPIVSERPGVKPVSPDGLIWDKDLGAWRPAKPGESID